LLTRLFPKEVGHYLSFAVLLENFVPYQGGIIVCFGIKYSKPIPPISRDRHLL
jgi:hypothetical protein